MNQDARIDKVVLTVTDYGRAIRFYKRMLGLKSEWENEASHDAGFRVGPTLLVIHERRNAATGGGARIYFTVPDIVREREELLEAGVACTEIRDLKIFKVVDFSDPDGNRLAITENTLPAVQ